MIDAHGAPRLARTTPQVVVQPQEGGSQIVDLSAVRRETVSDPSLATTSLRDTRNSESGQARTLGDLVDAALDHEAHGWEALVQHLYDVVYRYALARLGDVSAAEEVTQEVFIAATRSLRTLRTRNETAIRAWFLRITGFRVTDRIRQKSAEARRPYVEPAPLEDPEETVVRRHRAAEVRAAMEKLTETQREVLLRRFVMEESLEEVAAATRRPVGAVKSLQHRALQALTRILGPELADA